MDPVTLSQIGPYTVRRFVAEGGMAWVFEVADPNFEGRRLALKMLKPAAAEGEEFQRFVDEARIQAAIDHPNLVTIFDFGRDSETDCFYYTMSFVDGPSLAQRLAEDGTLGSDEAVRIFDSVLDGLAELHRRGIVHRDIKPANILIGSDGRARLADLGIARRLQESGRTRTGTAIGTIAYMSPEQARGLTVDSASDVFSVGLTLYEALAGQSLYAGVENLDSTNSMEVLGYLVSLARTGEGIDIRFPVEREAGIPAALRALVVKACQFHPEDRYADAGEMRRALKHAREARPRAPSEPTTRWPLVGAGLAVLLGLGTWWLIQHEQLRSGAEAALAAVQGFEARAPSLLERIAGLSPAPSEILLEELGDGLDQAEAYLDDCRQELAAGSFQVAERSCEKALGRYRELCQQGVAGVVGQRADERSAELRVQRELLVSAGAASNLLEAWSGLEEQVAATQPAATTDASATCEVLEAQLARLEAAEQALVTAGRLETRLANLWPELAEASRAAALAASEEAVATVKSPPYEQAMAAGREALARAEGLQEAEDFLAAREAYDEAASQFQAAGRIAPAAGARAEVRAFEQTIPEGGIGEWSIRIARADELFAREQWAEALRGYREALRGARAYLEAAAQQDLAQAAREAAESAREGARQEGAERSAPEALRAAQAAFDRAAAALEADRSEEASRGFEAATPLFESARQAAGAALAGARARSAEAGRELAELSADGQCARIESDTAKGRCQAAWEALARASAALEALDAPTAESELGVALAAAREAREAERKLQAEKPQPPRILARSPRREEIEVEQSRSLRVSVEAEDPNPGEVLTYDWVFRGTPLPGRGPVLDFVPAEGGLLGLTVSDPGGLSAKASWRLRLRRPEPEPPPGPSVAERDWKAEVQQALERYAGCISARSLSCLEQVWAFQPGDPYRTYWKSKFSRSDDLDVSVTIQSLSLRDDGRVQAVFDQLQVAWKAGLKGRPRSKSTTRWTYEAVLAPPESGEQWRIVRNRVLQDS